MTDYQLDTMIIHHFFCSTCGVRSFARGTGPDGSEMVAINAGCRDGVEPSTLAVSLYDGRSV